MTYRRVYLITKRYYPHHIKLNLGQLESIKNEIAESSRQLSEIQKATANRKFDLQWLIDEIHKKRSTLQQLQAQIYNFTVNTMWYR